MAMTNSKWSSVSIHTLPAVIIPIVSLQTISLAQAAGEQKPGEWKAVEDVFGFPAANLPGRVARFNMPRKDLHVTVGGTEVKPGLALGGWAAFHRMRDNDATIMGELVLAEDDVA